MENSGKRGGKERIALGRATGVETGAKGSAWARGFLLSLLAVLVGANGALADWRLTDESRVVYVSIKNNGIAENNVISGVSGTLSDDGSLAVALDLATVDTGVDIRNERMRELFFEVAQYASAELTGSIDPAVLAALDAGKSQRLTLPLTVSLHGVQRELSADLLAVPAGDRVTVTSTAPILVSAADFGLESGVATLRKVAGLDAISRAVPVTVDLVLQMAQ